MTKTCTKCRLTKSADEFYAHPKTKDRLTSWCRECTKAKARGHDSPPHRPTTYVDGSNEKACSKCKAVKPLTAFNDHPQTRSGKTSWCKDCVRARGSKAESARRYAKRKAKYPRELVDPNRKIRWVRAYKTLLKCAVCGEAESACLDFHHRNPAEKLFTLSSAADLSKRTMEEIKAEALKCDPLCANCHRKLHAGRISPLYGRLRRFREDAMRALFEHADYLVAGSRKAGDVSYDM